MHFAKPWMIITFMILMESILPLIGCGTQLNVHPTLEDRSASGALANALGGALSASSFSGTQTSSVPTRDRFRSFFPYAMASLITCPTYFNLLGENCTSNNTSTLWLTYHHCNQGTTTWTGYLQLSMTPTTQIAICGSFPNPSTPSIPGILTRQFVMTPTPSATPYTATVISSFGTLATIDHHSSFLGNFNANQETLITPLLNQGYGIQISFDAGGAKKQVFIAQRIYTHESDYSIWGTIPITETAGATLRTIPFTPIIHIYDNSAQVIGNATLANVIHTNACCHPTSGRITTTFTAASPTRPTNQGLSMLNQSEVLTFTGCNTATLLDTTGVTKNVILSRCL